MAKDSEYEKDLVNMLAFVILFHGDLGTFERVAGIFQWRCLETMAYR